jgi:hypothetical protein
MEIIEIISFHINNLDEILEVSFRTNLDKEDELREGKISFSDITDFGYKFHESLDDDFYDEDENDDFFREFDDIDLMVDENEILSFLNEYYVLFTDKLPKPELF